MHRRFSSPSRATASPRKYGRSSRPSRAPPLIDHPIRGGMSRRFPHSCSRLTAGASHPYRGANATYGVAVVGHVTRGRRRVRCSALRAPAWRISSAGFTSRQPGPTAQEKTERIAPRPLVIEEAERVSLLPCCSGVRVNDPLNARKCALVIDRTGKSPPITCSNRFRVVVHSAYVLGGG